MPNNVIIAIETSCDDTSMSLFVNGKLHHQITKSTLKEMRKFGGIVPEIASRGHCQVIDEIFNELIKKTNLDVSNITHIAYTAMPGLPGSLHIGKIYAKSLAYLLDVELIPINHMYGHIFSFAIENEELIKFPFISFIASGGHTTIYLVKSLTDIQILNTSSDDAIGEVLDKIGRNLGLEYPGGISIDKIYDENKTDLKLIDHFPCSKEFSFSGFKTSILNLINNKKEVDKIKIASSSLKWIVEESIRKIKFYLSIHNVKTLILGGGCSANSLLRKEITEIKDIAVHLPKLKFCGDNSAMIAFYAFLLLKNRV